MQNKANSDTGFDQLLKETVKESALLVPDSSLMEGRFIVGRMLGSGGMGVVYEAFDSYRDSNVALKILTSVDASGIYRLKQEFRALVDLAHPNLVGLHELFCDRNRWFFTMDLLPGYTLFDQPVAKLDDLDITRSIFAQLATGIQAVHEAGKLHRDLKPSNVILTPEGRVVIMDFGLASDQKVGGVGQTIVGDRISGTPQYMAPEQAAGHPATPASDWYAFGVMLFEALTGKSPFEGGQQAVLIYKQQEDAPQPSSINPDIPDDLDMLCVQLLQRNPEARPGWLHIMEVLGSIDESLDSLAPQDEIPFVGRIAELRALQDAFKATDKGQPVVVFLHGVSGVGKSTLVEQFLCDLERKGEAVVLTGRCYERESVPFKACDSLIDALSRHLRQLPPEQAGALLPRHVHAIAQLFPALQRLEFIKKLKQRRPLPPDPNELRRVAFLAFKELLTNIAAQEPLVLFVDDLQWSDIDGARLLSSMLSQPEPPSLLFVGAYRSEEIKTSSGLSTLHERIRSLEEVDVREIELRELNEQESQELAKDLLPEEIQDRAINIARESRGSPFFITELSRFALYFQDRDERFALKEVIKSRLDNLNEVEREVLEAIYVSARPVDPNLLRVVINKEGVAAALRRLQVDHLVRHVATGRSRKIRSYHDRIRELVVSGMDAESIKSWHSRLARSIEVSNSSDLIAITEHLLGAGDDVKAGSYASQAADRAAETLAFEKAARLYQIALERNPGNRENQRMLQTKLGTALANAGRSVNAAQAFMQAAEDARPEDELKLRHLAAQQWITTGHITEGMRELKKVLKSVGLKLHDSSSATIVDLLSDRARIEQYGLDFKTHLASEISKNELLELLACWTANQGLYYVDYLQAAAFSSRFLRLALRSGIVEGVVSGLIIEIAFRSSEGVENRPIVDDYLSKVQQLCDQIDNPKVLGGTRFAHGIAPIFFGEPFSATESLELAETIYIEKCTGIFQYLDVARNFLGICYVVLGSWRKLRQQWDLWIKDGEERNDLHLLTVQRTWPMGTVRWLAADRVDKAREQLLLGLTQWPWKAFDMQQWFAGVSESWIEQYSGNNREAFEIAERISKKGLTSPLRRFQLLRVIDCYNLALSALGLASTLTERNSLLEIARQQADKLSKEHYPMVDPFIHLIKGGVAYLEGDKDNGIKLLKETINAFDKAHLKLYKAATARQLGRSLGGNEGRALIAEADQGMKEEGVIRPDRIAAMLVPGFPDLPV